MTDLTRRDMIALSSAAMLMPGQLHAQDDAGATAFSWKTLIAQGVFGTAADQDSCERVKNSRAPLMLDKMSNRQIR